MHRDRRDLAKDAKKRRTYGNFNSPNMEICFIVILLTKNKSVLRRIGDLDNRFSYILTFEVMPTVLKLPIVSHPWASFAPCFQSHTSVCSFQQVSESAPSLRPLRLRNFKEQSLNLHSY